jgi:hypothetical protein
VSARMRRRQKVVALAALAAIVAVVVVGVVGAGDGRKESGSQVSSDPTLTIPAGSEAPPTTVAPAPADVAAARACAAFTVYLEDATHGRVPGSVGRALIEDAAVLLRGAETDKAAGRALPRWSTLGSDLLSAAEDVVDHKKTALESDGPAAAAQCRLVPAAAAAAGGYRRGS